VTEEAAKPDPGVVAAGNLFAALTASRLLEPGHKTLLDMFDAANRENLSGGNLDYLLSITAAQREVLAQVEKVKATL
jgi:hypothetical protein